MIPENIPAELRARDQWVCWRYEWRKEKWTKPPYQTTGENAKSNDSTTWTSFGAALAAYQRGGFDGVGFVQAVDDPFTIIDLDDARDPDTGKVAGWAVSLLGDWPSYVEVSPSAKGLRAIGRGKKPGPKCGPKKYGTGKAEVYDAQTPKYLTFTGHTEEGSPAVIVDAQAQVERVYAAVFTKDDEKKQAGKKQAHRPHEANGHATGTDAEILGRMFASKVGDKARELWDGRGPKDASAGDLSLCNYIAYYVGWADAATIDRLFRESKRMREKWDKKHAADGRTYGAMTIDTALDGRDDYWHPEPTILMGGVPISSRASRKAAWAGTGEARPALDQSEPEQTDSGNAIEFARDHAADVRWTHSHGWIIWDGRRWKPDDTLAVVELGKVTATRLVRDAAATYKAAASAVAEATEAGDPDAEGKAKAAQAGAKRKLSNAKYCRQKKGLEAMLALARSITGIAVTFDQFDTEHHLFNVLNGTIDMKAGTIRPHRKEDHLTRLAPVEYDPAVAAPTFEQFLASTFNRDADLIDWLNHFLGSCLTGDTKDELLVVFWGSGSNGKSKFMELMLAILGDYAWKAPAEILMARKHDPHPEERASLCGRRFVATCETDQGRRLNEGLVKELTGGDSINARFMHKNSFSFRPTWKIVLSTNYRPQIRGQDHGIWRRVKLVPFAQRFWKSDEPPGLPELQADMDLGTKLKAEYPGILAWLVLGAARWYAHGLPPCKTVDEATQTYRKAEDMVRQFVDQRIEFDRHTNTKAGAIYGAYKSWHEAEGMTGPPMTGTTFGTRFGEIVKAQGAEKDEKRSVYKGVTLTRSDSNDR